MAGRDEAMVRCPCGRQYNSSILGNCPVCGRPSRDGEAVEVRWAPAPTLEPEPAAELSSPPSVRMVTCLCSRQYNPLVLTACPACGKTTTEARSGPPRDAQPASPPTGAASEVPPPPPARYCTECGAQLAGSAPKFCATCGTPVLVSDGESVARGDSEKPLEAGLRPRSSAPAGRYPDPLDRSAPARYWTGEMWTTKEEDSPTAREAILGGGVPAPDPGSRYTTPPPLVPRTPTTTSAGLDSRPRTSPTPGTTPTQSDTVKVFKVIGVISAIVLVVLAIGVSASGGMNRNGASGSTAQQGVAVSTDEGRYTTDPEGLNRAIDDCAREVIGAYEFPKDADLMQGAALVDAALAAVGNCVVKKNPEYLCGAAEGMTTGCFFSDTAIEGVYLNRNSKVDAALRKAGAPGY